MLTKPAIISLILVSLGTGCNRGSGSNHEDGSDNIGTDINTGTGTGTDTDTGNGRTTVNDVASIVLAATSATTNAAACTSGPGGTVTGCEMEERSFTPATPRPNGQTIMVLDRGMYFSPMTRYAAKVVGIYERRADGSVTAAEPKFNISRDAYRIVDSLNRAPVHIMQSATDAFSSAFSTKFGAGIPAAIKRFDHGTPIFNMLADFNPDAQFVVVNSFSGAIPTNTQLCSLATDDGWTATSQAVDRTITELTELITQFDVRMINLSAGHDYNVTRRVIAQSCPGTNRDLVLQRDAQLWQRFVVALGSLPNVLLVEAAPYPLQTLTQNDPSAPVDCMDVPHRIRVGYFTKADSRVGEEGSGDEAMLGGNADQVNAKACVDLFVNAGFETASDGSLHVGEQALYASKWGLEARRWLFEEGGMATSYATPLALSYLHHLQAEVARSGGQHLSPLELKSIATANGARRLRDPLRNRSLESLRH